MRKPGLVGQAHILFMNLFAVAVSAIYDLYSFS